MNGQNISESFPALFDGAIDLNDALTPIFLVVSIAALIGKGMQCMGGDLRGMMSGITTIVIVSILIPTFPGIVNDIQLSLNKIAQSAGADPTQNSEEFANLVVGETGNNKDVGFLDILFDDDGGIGKAISYFLISIGSMLALLIQYVYAIGQQFLLIYAVALSPIFFGMFLLRDTRSIAINYFLGTFAIAMWPIGFAVGDLGISSLLAAAADAEIQSDFLPGLALDSSQGFFYGLFISLWIAVSTFYTPKLIYQVVTTGANAGGLLLQRLSSTIAQATAFSIIARGSAQLTGASRAKTAAATTIGGFGGAIAGATGTQAVLLPAVVGVAAMKSNLGGSGDKPTDYNAKAAEVANKKKP